MEHERIDQTALLARIGAHQKVLVMAPRASGKSLFLSSYRFMKHDGTNSIHYYTNSEEERLRFKGCLKQKPGITRIRCPKKSPTCLYKPTKLVLMDNATSMSLSRLNALLGQDCFIVAVASVDKRSEASLFSTYGFSVIEAPLI